MSNTRDNLGGYINSAIETLDEASSIAPTESLPIFTKLKIILLGNSGVGKTSLLSQYVNGMRSPDLMYTIGVEFKIKDIQVDGKRIRLALWDTAGQERWSCCCFHRTSYTFLLNFRFRSITQTYYRGVQGAVLVFDVTNKNSFQRLTEWIFELELYCREDPIKLLIGNKSDLDDQREVTKVEAMEFAKRHNILYMETSAHSGDEVEYAFEVLTSEILFKTELWKPENQNRSLSTVKLGEDCLEWDKKETRMQQRKRSKRCC